MSSTSLLGNRAEVPMSYTTFAMSSVTIHKGGKITLVDDVAVPHDFAKGTWYKQHSSTA